MKDITINPTATIRQAMEALDKTAEKVLLVVDENHRLIGTLTDGDIRRYILKERNLIGTIETAYFRNPIFVFENEDDPEGVKELLRKNKIDLIPVLKQDRKIADFITWEKAFGNNKKDTFQDLGITAVIMAGGHGTRLMPFTKVLPKPLVPVGDKPVIDHIIDRFVKHGVSDFYLTVHHMSKILRAYFEEKSSNYKIRFVEEAKPLGTAGSLKYLEGKLHGDFFVSNCDIIVDANYVDIYDFHQENKNDITLVASAKQFDIPYGVCELNGAGSLKQIIEKPAYNFLVNTGLYLLNSRVLSLIPDDNFFHITRLIEKVMQEGGTIGVYPVSENAWIDVGQWAEYRKAMKAIEGL
ncbi:MAG: nucleotidyltransferase family protein [Deltaproteobacteria bacterium]|nr:nucleotidyltransferase family protein [Deltaproteobacteria bacterium]